MDEDSALIEQILREDQQQNGIGSNENDAYAWKTVSYQKRSKKALKPSQETIPGDLPPNSASDVFRPIEQYSEDRRKRAAEAQRAAAAASAVDIIAANGSRRHSDDEDSDEEAAGSENGGVVEVKKTKPKKPKKPKVTVGEAAAKIDAAHLGDFLVDITASYDAQQDILLMRFADYFGRAFALVTSSQFPWLKIFKESTVARMVDIPLSHISEDVYKTSVDWLAQRSPEALGSFVLWSLDSILSDFASHQGTTKGSKKVVQQTSSKSQVAIFTVLAMALRRKPDVLISLLPIMGDNPKYQGQDKLPVTVWVVVQASQGDLAVGLYMWVRLLLPVLCGKSCNPQSRDLILQLLERILSSPKARTILVNGAVKKGERLVPPSALELLMRVTFPAPSSRVKATERFESAYPVLKDVALAGSPGSKAMKQVAQQILHYAAKAAGEGVPNLSSEACDIFIWCLTQSPECYKQWQDVLYLDSLEASVAVLRKLSNEWKEHSIKHATLDPLRETLKCFRQKNEEALTESENADRAALLKDADKYCKIILGRVSRGGRCLKGMIFVSVAFALGAAIMSQNVHDWDLDLKKLTTLFGLQ